MVARRWASWYQVKISINAPSYRRPYGVETLKYLPQTRVWVCESEVEDYRKANPEAEIISVPLGVQGNLCRIRNYILDNSDDDCVCLIDDDLQGMGYFETGKEVQIKREDFMDWLTVSTVVAMEFGAKMWGVNIIKDKKAYREYSPISTVSYIGGPFSCHLRSNLRYDEKLPLKEDYDMTLQHLNRHRLVVRFNKYWYNAKQGCKGSNQVGGCAVYRNLEVEREQLYLLQKKWGSRIVAVDSSNWSNNKKKNIDINPIIRVPIKGI